MSSKNASPLFAASLVAAVLATTHGAPVSAATVYLNETDTAGEADFVNLQFPASIVAGAGTLVPTVYGRIYETGVTEASGGAASVTASVGYGAAGSDPRTTAWTWFAASFNTQVGNDDEYQGAFLAPGTPGTYSYTYRFSFGGDAWTLADLNGAGSNGGLAFSLDQLGTLTVNGPPVPIPGALLLMALPAAGLLRLGSRRRDARKPR